MMRKLFIFIGILVLSVTLLAVGVVLTGLLAPQVLVNRYTLNWAKNLAPYSGYTVGWQAAEVDIQSPSLLRKSVSFKFAALEVQGESFDVGADYAALAFDVSFKRRELLLPRIGPATVRGGSVALKTPPPAPVFDEKPAEPLDVDAIIGFFQGRRIEPISVAISSFSMGNDPQQLVSTATLELTRPSVNNLVLVVTVDGKAGAPIETLRLKALAVSEQDGSGLKNADITGRIRLQKGRTAALTATVRPLGDGRSNFAADSSIQMDGNHFIVEGDGEADRQKISARMRATVRLPNGPAATVALGPCTVEASSKDFLAADFRVQLDCNGAIGRRAVLGREILINKLIPERLTFHTKATATMTVKPAGRTVAFQTDFDMTKLVRDPLSLTGGFEVDGVVDLKQATKPRQLTVHFDTVAAIKQFNQLIVALSGTMWSIPAPLNQLRGMARCSAEGSIDLVQKSLSVPINCMTSLSGGSQRLYVKAQGGMKRHAKAGLQLDATVDLTDVRLVLPDIDLTKPLPRLVPDKRIGVFDDEPESDTGPSSFFYQVVIRTPKNRPVEVANSLTKEPAHIDVDVTLRSDMGMKGDVALRPFAIEMFRRTADVELLKLHFDPLQSAIGVEGRARLPSNDYRVFVSLLGTTAKPTFQIYTEPPLPEREAIAVLLFGYRPDVLAEDELRTADEMRAAMADSAIGLLSMYVLASSPIESVGYNPYTGIFSARVKLREGLSLTVGANTEDTTEVGLRRRISRNWAVETTTVKEAKEDVSARTMLKWSKRY